MKLSARLIQKFLYKISHISKFPKADTTACLLNVAGRGLAPQYLIDVGANRGKWSRKFRAVFPECSCVLIEPQVEMQPELDRFCSQNPGCRWVQAGAGDAPGKLLFTPHPDTVSSTFRMTPAEAAAKGLAQREVQILTLDDICRTMIGGPPDVVKIDAEGFEAEVLRGAQTLMGRTELFFIEAHLISDDGDSSSLIELTALMSDYGYAPYDFTWFGKRPHDGAIGLCEVAFARKSGILRAYHGWHKQAAA